MFCLYLIVQAQSSGPFTSNFSSRNSKSILESSDNKYTFSISFKNIPQYAQVRIISDQADIWMTLGQINMGTNENQIEIHVSFDYCTKNDPVKIIKNLEENSPKEFIIDGSDQIFYKCSHQLATYQLTLKNSLSELIQGSRLFYRDVDDDQFIELSKGESIEIKKPNSYNLKVEVKGKTDFCDSTDTIVLKGDTKPTFVEVTDSDFPQECLPYFVIVKNQVPEGVTISYKKQGESEDLNPWPEDGIHLFDENEFIVEIYYQTDICTSHTLSSKKITAVKNVEPINYDFLDIISDECKSYQIIFDISGLSSEYKIGYKKLETQDPSDAQEISKELKLKDQKFFKVSLFLLQSPNEDCANKFLKTYDSSNNENIISLTDSDIPNECKEVVNLYYINVNNSITKEGYTLMYYLYGDDQRIKLEKGETLLKYKSREEVHFVIQSKFSNNECNAGYLRANNYKTNTITITDDEIYDECKPPYAYFLSFDISEILQSYIIEYTTNFSTIFIKTNNNFHIQNDTPFNISLYATNKANENLCRRALLGNYQSLYTNDFDVVQTLDKSFDMSKQCAKADKPYEVSGVIDIQEGYKFSYSLSYEGHQKIHEINDEKSIKALKEFSEKYNESFILSPLISTPDSCTNIRAPKLNSEIVVSKPKLFNKENLDDVCESYKYDYHEICFDTPDWPSFYQLNLPVNDYEKSFIIFQPINRQVRIIDKYDKGPITRNLYLSTDKCTLTKIGKYSSQIKDNAICQLMTKKMADDLCNKYKKKFPIGAIIGIVVGVVVIIAVIIIVVIIIKRKKRNTSQNEEGNDFAADSI